MPTLPYTLRRKSKVTRSLQQQATGTDHEPDVDHSHRQCSFQHHLKQSARHDAPRYEIFAILLLPSRLSSVQKLSSHCFRACIRAVPTEEDTKFHTHTKYRQRITITNYEHCSLSKVIKSKV